MTLFTESGGDLSSRIDEAQRIARMLAPSVDEMSPKEAEFVQRMLNTNSCSPKQVFWLRDLKDKYL